LKKSGFSLGANEEIRLKVVQTLRSLLNSRFKNVVSTIRNKYNLVSSTLSSELIDINTEVLDTLDIK
jgi:hypothetical protein